MNEIKPEYLPRPAVIKKVIEENSQIKTFVLTFVDNGYNQEFTYKPGQFMMLSVPHCGEAPISFSSSPSTPGTFNLSIRKAGKLTTAMHALNAGDMVGLRGPYGKSFPMGYLLERDLLFVAGGIGLAPLSSIVKTCLENPDYQRRIDILYGSRAPEDIAFREEIAAWQQHQNVNCLLTVDCANPEWQGATGLVTTLLDQIELNPNEQTALVCGPPLMIKAVLAELSARNFADVDIITTMERHMKCGVGVCRHCHMDDKLVCVDGPVFNLAQLKEMDVMELKG